MRSWSRSPSARSSTTGTGSVDGHYTELTQAGVTSRAAATLTGLPRSTATRRQAVPVPAPAVRRVPANRLSAVERLQILAVLDAPRFVDLPPIPIWAQLLGLGEGGAAFSVAGLSEAVVDVGRGVEPDAGREVDQLWARAWPQIPQVTKLRGFRERH